MNAANRPPHGTRLFAPFAPLLLVIAVMFALPANAQSAPPHQPAERAAPTAIAEYVISPDDVLSVFVVDVPELSRTYRVGVDGTMAVPLVPKAVPAAGLTLTQFSKSLEHILKDQGLVSDPHVNTSVEQSRLHAVSITGAVKKPQIYPVLAQTTLLDLLSQAEGLADDAGNTALVYRGDIAMHALGISEHGATPQEREAARTEVVDLKRLLESGAPELNMVIYPGDRVTVPRAGIVYVVGAVNRPGGFPIRNAKNGMTVLQAVALAEDLKSTAVRKKAVIIRADSQAPAGRKQIAVDLKKVLSGSTEDVMLQAEDILFVPDSSSQRLLRRGAEAIVQAATGIAIYGRY